MVRGPLSLVCCVCCQTPECVSRLVKAGMRVLVQKGAGEQATFSDQDYRDAGATVLDSRDGGWVRTHPLIRQATHQPACLPVR